MFWITLAGGPCAGHYDAPHAPKVVRAVRGPHGQLAVLDAPGDEPDPAEECYAYTWSRKHGPGFVCGIRGRGRGRSSARMLTYVYLGPLDRQTGEVVSPLSMPQAEQIADEYLDAQAAAFFADRAPSERERDILRAAAAVRAPAASPQGALF